VKFTVRVWCFLGAAFLAEAAPFSHKLHLGMGLECVTCHRSAPTSTRADDDLLPAKQVCADCHDASTGPQRLPAPPVAVVHFSHAVHLKMGSNLAPIIAKAIDKGTYLQPSGDVRSKLNTRNACQACHRGLEESDQVSAANMPKMADCLVCHTKIEVPWSCEDCHAKGAALKPDSHKRETFFDTHSQGAFRAQRATCAVCHGREFTCMGCH
jgi:Cytochrome c7 and related cytochrome c